jgi:hypothetical protein
MAQKNTRKLMLIVIALSLCTPLKAFSQSGDKQATPTPKDTRRTFRLQIEVTTGNPRRKVEGAVVQIESEDDGGKYTKDAKTNREGIVSLDHVPQGRVRIQVVAKDHETFGDKYTLTRDETVKINLRRIGDQNNPQ